MTKFLRFLGVFHNQYLRHWFNMKDPTFYVIVVLLVSLLMRVQRNEAELIGSRVGLQRTFAISYPSSVAQRCFRFCGDSSAFGIGIYTDQCIA